MEIYVCAPDILTNTKLCFRTQSEEQKGYNR